MKRAGVLILLAGCAPAAAPPPPIIEASGERKLAVEATATAPVVTAVQQPADAGRSLPVPFAYPADLTGKPLARALAPTTAPAPPLPNVAAPKPRTSAAERGELPLAVVAARVAAPPLSARKAALPSPPPERVPGVPVPAAAEIVAVAPATVPPATFRTPAVAPPTAADVPKLAQQLPDRAALDDPTADLSSGRVVFTPLVAAGLAVPLLKLFLPDPFEWAEQGRPPAGGEFGAGPVAVPPRRPN